MAPIVDARTYALVKALCEQCRPTERPGRVSSKPRVLTGLARCGLCESSYQLETTTSLAPAIATVLNVSPNHLDRYAGIADDASAKAGIFANAAVLISQTEHVRVIESFSRSLMHIATGELGQDLSTFDTFEPNRQMQMRINENVFSVLGRHVEEFGLASSTVGGDDIAPNVLSILPPPDETDVDPETNIVDVYVGYLRRKIDREGQPRLLHTVRGAGYVLRANGEDR